MIVEEIMTKNVISVQEETPLGEIAEIISSKRIHGVPVVDKEDKVVGIITETDFFTKDSSNVMYIPQLIDFVKSGKVKNSAEDDQVIKAMMTATAKDVMTKNCTSVGLETSFEELVLLIRKNKFNTFPVVDKNNVLIGIVTVYDIIKMI